MRAALLDHVRDLEALGDADTREFVLRRSGDFPALELQSTRAGRESATHNVKERALGGAVGADEGAEFARLEARRNVVQGKVK